MSNEKHTPMPWRAEGTKIFCEDTEIASTAIPFCGVYVNNGKTAGADRKRASYIVKAVNAYEAHVNLLIELEMLTRVNCPINDGSLMHKKIKTYLAKAGVK